MATKYPILKKTKIDRTEGSVVRKMLDFLGEHYQITRNQFTKQVIAIHLDTGEQLSVDDIYIDMLESDIRFSLSNLKILFNSNRIEEVNPIREYFLNLKGKYSGVSQLDLLCSHFQARKFGDGINYADRKNRIMKKWLVSSVAQAIGLYINEAAMILIDPVMGAGKSFFFEWLLKSTTELHDYYISSLDLKEIHDYNAAMARYHLLNLDEMANVKKGNVDEMKSLITKRTVVMKPKRGMQQIQLPRISNVGGSTNYGQEAGGFLFQNDAGRRWACIELTGIDKEYSNVVDIHQLYAECLMLIENNFDYKWNQEDYRDFEKYNKRYIIETPSMKYVRKHFAPTASKNGEFMSASDIYSALVNNGVPANDKVKLSVTEIGKAMISLNFIRDDVYQNTTKNNKSGYYVTKLN